MFKRVLYLSVLVLFATSVSAQNLTPEQKKELEAAIQSRYDYLISKGVTQEEATLAALLGVDEDIYLRWQKVSPNLQELLEFKLLGVRVEEAIEWRSLGFRADDANQWKDIDLEQLIGEWWYKIGLESNKVSVPPSIAAKFKAAEITNLWGGLWYATGHDPEDAIRQDRRWEKKCNGRAEKMGKLKQTGGVDGTCYHIIAPVLQWISMEKILIKIGSFVETQKIFYLKFPERNAPENGFYGIVRRNGTFKYRNIMGKTTIIPRLEVIAFIYGD